MTEASSASRRHRQVFLDVLAYLRWLLVVTVLPPKCQHTFSGVHSSMTARLFSWLEGPLFLGGSGEEWAPL